jgi:hypothetical protein
LSQVELAQLSNAVVAALTEPYVEESLLTAMLN